MLLASEDNVAIFAVILIMLEFHMIFKITYYFVAACIGFVGSKYIALYVIFMNDFSGVFIPKASLILSNSNLSKDKSDPNEMLKGKEPI